MGSFRLLVPPANDPSYQGRTTEAALPPRPPNVPLLRALWSLLDGIWGISKGSWGVLARTLNLQNRQHFSPLFHQAYSSMLGTYEDYEDHMPCSMYPIYYVSCTILYRKPNVRELEKSTRRCLRSQQLSLSVWSSFSGLGCWVESLY